MQQQRAAPIEQQRLLLDFAPADQTGSINAPNPNQSRSGASERSTFLSPILAAEVPDHPEEEAPDVMAQEVSNMTSIDSLVLRPNVADNEHVIQNIMRVVNPPTIAPQESSLGSTVIKPGMIGLALDDGKVVVVSPGRWRMISLRAEWAGQHYISDEVIRYESLTIVRIKKGFYGLARENGKPLLLSEGLHVKNSRLFEFVEAQPMNQKHLSHGTIHILRVQSGEYALVMDGNMPKVLTSGTYVIDSPLFVFDKFVNVNQEYIKHHTIHILQVPKGKCALVFKENKPLLIPEGLHRFSSQQFTYVRSEVLNQTCIKHGTITHFRVRNGEIGLAWDNNEPIFIEKPGFYEVDSINFAFEKCSPATDKEISLGARRRIVVCDGEVGISYLNGKLEILEPKTHIFDANNRLFKGFLSTQQQCLPLSEDNKPEPKNKEKAGYIQCDTKDFVCIGIKADVFYKITNPEKTIKVVGNQNLVTKIVRETGIATLQAIIRSSSLNEVAQSKEPAAVSVQAQSQLSNPHKASAPLFFDKVHDEFVSRLHDDFSARYGIELTNIRIESFNIMDTELAGNISKQAMITATTQTQLANLVGQREIATAEMERDADVKRIKVESEAITLQTENMARNKALLDQARAKAEAAIIIAQGDADALMIKAEAEAQAVELAAHAEGKRAELLGHTAIGGQLALFELQTKMVSKSLKGVQKTVYLPSNLNNSPFGLFNFGGCLTPQGQPIQSTIDSVHSVSAPSGLNSDAWSSSTSLDVPAPSFK